MKKILNLPAKVAPPIKKILFVAIFFMQSACTSHPDNQTLAPVYTRKQSRDVESSAQLYPYKSQDQKVQTVPYQEHKSSSATFEMEAPPSPAVVALVSEADSYYKTGDLDSAVAAIERALRIEQRNPNLVYKLAAVRLKQGKPRMAEDLAKKANLLAGNNTLIKKQSWLLISEARRMQGDNYGAKEARQNAKKY